MDNQKKAFGFRGDMFPILTCIIGMSSIGMSYFIARHQGHVDPFPKTDITHCGIGFPEYIPFRIGLLSIIPLLVISWQLTKNFLQTLSFKYKQQADPRLNNMGWIGALGAFGLAISTATISGGKGDMNWTLHTIGATSFFIVTIYNCFTVSSVYKQLWQYDQFCSRGSFLYKTTVRSVGFVLLGVQIFCWLGLVDLGSLIEWLATFYLLGYFMSLGLDLKNMDLMLYYMDTAYSEVGTLYKVLYNKMVASTTQIKLTSHIMMDIYRIFSDFAKSLDSLAVRINGEIIKEAEGDNERIVNSYQLLSNLLLKISENNKRMASRLKNQVSDPFGMFVQNYRETNKTIARKAETLIEDLQRQKQSLTKCQQQYYHSWVKTQKSKEDIERAIQKIERGGKNSDLIKANDQSMRLSMATEEYEREYRESIDHINSQWKTINQQFQKMCTHYESNESSRLSFSRSSVLSALRIFTQFNHLSESQLQLRTKQSQDLVKVSSKTQPLIDTLAAGKFQKFIEQEKKEAFMSYEDSKRKKESRRDEKADHTKQLFKSVSDKHKELIDNAIGLWMGDSKTAELENIRNIMTSTSAHSLYTVESLYQRMQKTTAFYSKLEEQHFNQLLFVLLSISKSLESATNDRSVEYMYKLINISMRIIKKKKDKNSRREMMCTLLGKDNPTFTNQKLWTAILNHINHKYAQKKKEEDQKTSVFGKGLAFVARGLTGLVTGKKDSQQGETFEPAHQITRLISSLEVSTEHSLPLLRKLLNCQSGPAFEMLKQSLYSNQDKLIRKKLTDPKQVRQTKDQMMGRLLTENKWSIEAFRIMAKTGLLSEKDIKIRLVCRDLREIDREILSRLNINMKWVRILHIRVRDFEKLREEVEALGISPSTEEIITLDVNRSLHLHTENLSNKMLNTILKVYAYYNKEIGYCQGMNYLAGYIHIRLRDVNQTYEVFQKLMTQHFAQLFANEFAMLKVKMYQFDRILNIFVWEVAQHFKNQMIMSECYIVSWMITLFSATLQITKHSYLVDTLWDRFIVHGWREFFRMTVLLFTILKDDLVELTFDKALHYLSELTKSELFTGSYEQLLDNKRIDIRTLNQQLDRIPITNELLATLQKDYQLT